MLSEWVLAKDRLPDIPEGKKVSGEVLDRRYVATGRPS